MTPEQIAEVRPRLVAFAGEMLGGLARSDQRAAGELYVRGLLTDGRRKSMQPMAARLGIDHQRLQQFITSSTWDYAAVRRNVARWFAASLPVEALVVDDTGFAKDGPASPCVARQYSGTLGKVGNCQVGVSVHLVNERASCAADWRLFCRSPGTTPRLMTRWRRPARSAAVSGPASSHEGHAVRERARPHPAGSLGPTKDDAAVALSRIRETFKTFCFADAETIEPIAGGVATVDISKAPGRDEFSFLVALLTAVCRPSLHLAPGVLLRAAPVSGAGAGKGLLARCICIIAFGREPHAVTAGANAEELEKRIAAELIEGSPALFLDNLNNTSFQVRPSRERDHGTAGAGAVARPVADGAVERIRVRDPDRQRTDCFRGPSPPVCGGGF